MAFNVQENAVFIPNFSKISLPWDLMAPPHKPSLIKVKSCGVPPPPHFKMDLRCVYVIIISYDFVILIIIHLDLFYLATKKAHAAL